MSRDEKLELEEMERLCRRLNVSLGREEILKRFKVSCLLFTLFLFVGWY